jgi:hypothetical protein
VYLLSRFHFHYLKLWRRIEVFNFICFNKALCTCKNVSKECNNKFLAGICEKITNQWKVKESILWKWFWAEVGLLALTGLSIKVSNRGIVLTPYQVLQRSIRTNERFFSLSRKTFEMKITISQKSSCNYFSFFVNHYVNRSEVFLLVNDCWLRLTCLVKTDILFLSFCAYGISN